MAGKENTGSGFESAHFAEDGVCGFALVDLNGEEDEEPCYLAVRPLRNLDV